MNTIVNQTPYLPTTWEFPNDIGQLSVALTRSYVNISNTVNARTIGLFGTTRPVINGEQWFVFKNQKQQGLRQVFVLPNISVYPYTQDHEIDLNRISGFTNIYGTFTDGTNWYPLPFVAVANANTTQVNILVTPTQIVINGGGGPGQPAIKSGFVVLEWISFT